MTCEMQPFDVFKPGQMFEIFSIKVAIEKSWTEEHNLCELGINHPKTNKLTLKLISINISYLGTK